MCAFCSCHYSLDLRFLASRQRRDPSVDISQVDVLDVSGFVVNVTFVVCVLKEGIGGGGGGVLKDVQRNTERLTGLFLLVFMSVS